MHNTSFFVQIFQRLRHLHDDMPGQLLAEVRETDDLVEELAARAELQHDIVILPGLGEVN